MKLLITFILSISTTAMAWDNPDITRERTDTSYKSRFGNEYQYDLSKPQDRIQYKYDRDARRRDAMDIDPRRNIERDLGEIGGGKRERKRW